MAVTVYSHKIHKAEILQLSGLCDEMICTTANGV